MEEVSIEKRFQSLEHRIDETRRELSLDIDRLRHDTHSITIRVGGAVIMLLIAILGWSIGSAVRPSASFIPQTQADVPAVAPASVYKVE